MNALTYDTLFLQIINYANRNINDKVFTDSIPMFISNAQQRIWRESKDLGFETLTTMGNFQANNPLISKPNNWNKTVSFAVFSLDTFGNTNVYFLEPHTYEYCIGVWPNSNKGNVDNPPLYYCDRELNTSGTNDSNYADPNLKNTPYSAWFVSPTPYATWNYQITYLATVQNISKQSEQNILTLKFPDLLFYSSMCEAFSFTQESERLQIFEGLYAKALESMNAQTQDRYSDRTSNRSID